MRAPARCANSRRRRASPPRSSRSSRRRRGELLYDLPEDLVGKLWKGRYRGQRQIWFLMRFLGTDADVNIETAHPEFRAWKWVAPAELPHLIVPFKKALYEAVLAEFAAYL